MFGLILFQVNKYNKAQHVIFYYMTFADRIQIITMLRRIHRMLHTLYNWLWYGRASVTSSHKANLACTRVIGTNSTSTKATRATFSWTWTSATVRNTTLDWLRVHQRFVIRHSSCCNRLNKKQEDHKDQNYRELHVCCCNYNENNEISVISIMYFITFWENDSIRTHDIFVGLDGILYF